MVSPLVNSHPWATATIVSLAISSFVVAADTVYDRNLVYVDGGYDCFYKPSHKEWEYRGNTVDGRPYYWNEMKASPLNLFQQTNLWLYYESDCDGK